MLEFDVDTQRSPLSSTVSSAHSNTHRGAHSSKVNSTVNSTVNSDVSSTVSSKVRSNPSTTPHTTTRTHTHTLAHALAPTHTHTHTHTPHLTLLERTNRRILNVVHLSNLASSLGFRVGNFSKVSLLRNLLRNLLVNLQTVELTFEKLQVLSIGYSSRNEISQMSALQSFYKVNFAAS